MNDKKTISGHTPHEPPMQNFPVPQTEEGQRVLRSLRDLAKHSSYVGAAGYSFGPITDEDLANLRQRFVGDAEMKTAHCFGDCAEPKEKE